jgi:hypothetical protein
MIWTKLNDGLYGSPLFHAIQISVVPLGPSSRKLSLTHGFVSMFLGHLWNWVRHGEKNPWMNDTVVGYVETKTAVICLGMDFHYFLDEE